MSSPERARHDRLDATDILHMVTAFRDALRTNREAINRLNVYPVPDGDTGTNMALTLESVCNEIGAGPDPSRYEMGAVCQAIAHGSLMGARGNSGVILSQILRGLTETFRTADEVGPGELRRGLRASADAAVAAVMH